MRGILFISFLSFCSISFAMDPEPENLKTPTLLSHAPLREQVEKLGGKAFAMDTSCFKGATAVHNPSLIKYNGKTFMTLRVQGHRSDLDYDAETFIAEVNSSFHILWNKTLLNPDDKKTHEDARLFILDDKLYVSWVSDVSYRHGYYQTCMELGKLEKDMQIHTRLRPDIDSNRDKDCLEKNWCIFQTGARKFVINWVEPVTVYEYLSQDLEKPYFLTNKDKKLADWRHGHIRASTTPILIPDLNQYISFFHSFQYSGDETGNIRVYFLGAMLLNHTFDVTYYTRRYVLISTPHVERLLGAYTVLPYGCILEHDQLVLSMGVNDRQAWIVKLPLKSIMQLMTKVEDKEVTLMQNLALEQSLGQSQNMMFAHTPVKKILLPGKNTNNFYLLKGSFQIAVAPGAREEFTLPNGFYELDKKDSGAKRLFINRDKTHGKIFTLPVWAEFATGNKQKVEITLPSTIRFYCESVEGAAKTELNPTTGILMLSK